jgi:hypothetical protein
MPVSQGGKCVGQSLFRLIKISFRESFFHTKFPLNSTGSIPGWIKLPDLYSVADLVSINNGKQNISLEHIYDACKNHIRECEVSKILFLKWMLYILIVLLLFKNLKLCTGHGYICESCNKDEIIFPFDMFAVSCDSCNSVYHRDCWAIEKMICKKCGNK